MERSDQIGELVTALAKAQGEFTTAVKDSDNPYYGSKYADLASVISAVRPALSKNGIAVMQFIQSDLEEQTATVTTSLHHGEQFISITTSGPAVSKGKDGLPKFDVQSLGAAWTYLRRYPLQAILGLASEDDDGNSLQGNNPPIHKRVKPEDVPMRQGPVMPDAPPQTSVPRVDQGPFLKSDDLLQCVIKGVTEKTSKKQTKYLTVTVNGRLDGFNYLFCYHQSLFSILKSAVDKNINLRFAKKLSEDERSIQYYSLEDVLWMDGVEYVDGVAIEAPKEEK